MGLFEKCMTVLLYSLAVMHLMTGEPTHGCLYFWVALLYWRVCKLETKHERK